MNILENVQIANDIADSISRPIGKQDVVDNRASSAVLNLVSYL